MEADNRFAAMSDAVAAGSVVVKIATICIAVSVHATAHGAPGAAAKSTGTVRNTAVTCWENLAKSRPEFPFLES